MTLTLIQGDCMEAMRDLDDNSVDLILCDLPYGITNNKWDSVLPLPELWESYSRIAKPTAAIVLTASQPFTSALIMSNPSMFKHEWIWLKNRGSNFANTGRAPMKEHESVLVFSKGRWTYNKQMQERTGGGLKSVGKANSRGGLCSSTNYGNRNTERTVATLPELRVPSTWQKFNCEVGHHPTQKPVALMAYMVRTYSNPGDVVLDNCMGSGTTGVACVQEGRSFIGIEKDESYFKIATDRIHNTPH